MAAGDDSSALPDRLGRYRVRGWLDADAKVAYATDTIGERDAEMVLVPFGPDRIEERETAVARWRTLSSVAHPAIQAVLDAGAWHHDAFLAREVIASPTTPLEEWLSGADGPARARACAELLGAASTLAAHRLSLASVDVVVDGYGQPKLRGLGEASDGDATLDARVLALAAELDADPRRKERIARASEADVSSLLAELSRDAKLPPSAFAADVARGQEPLSRAARGGQMQVGLLVLGAVLFLLVALMWLAR